MMAGVSVIAESQTKVLTKMDKEKSLDEGKIESHEHCQRLERKMYL